MRTMIAFLLLLSCSLQTLSQQNRPVTVKILTPGMQCDNCKKKVEDQLKFEDGVVKFVAYPKTRYVMVTYIKERTNIEIIKTAIANGGYDADDVTANEDSYKRLPTSCKKPEDGGTHKHTPATPPTN